MLVTYPAVFYFDDTDGENLPPYFITFPDIEGAGTQGKDMTDAMAMASDYLGIMLADLIEKGENLPKASNINSLTFENADPFKGDDDFPLVYDANKSFISLVMVDVAGYLGQDEPVKKTLTIPKWADKLGKEMSLNFSQTLTEAIAEKKLSASNS
ncbi:Predicted nuclease of the RNAse H fold, HicB family [Streptococcus henryi]|uniref:Predicted nuclease of the RNAse H fold, HicB family n=1 Tax=Streptococcus henryi TaxID=439219 RepID=A0A1G6A241_9STRE|nr:type II toxin-antitoxin system HicB family antitoxin [Streptococcus henryi]SDB02509.1 Predicted nuclease of the RNAse H fold, HicB family [Streptococcus henryi]